VDNLDDVSIARGYLPRLNSRGGHVLITTRNPNSPDIPAEGLRVDVHEPEEAKELLLQCSQLRGEIVTGSAAEEEARVIVRSVGYLALAIEQAAAYVRSELAKDIFQIRFDLRCGTEKISWTRNIWQHVLQKHCSHNMDIIYECHRKSKPGGKSTLTCVCLLESRWN
jgi:hypothetical protein